MIHYILIFLIALILLIFSNKENMIASVRNNLLNYTKNIEPSVIDH